MNFKQHYRQKYKIRFELLHAENHRTQL